MAFTKMIIKKKSHQELVTPDGGEHNMLFVLLFRVPKRTPKVSRAEFRSRR